MMLRKCILNGNRFGRSFSSGRGKIRKPHLFEKIPMFASKVAATNENKKKTYSQLLESAVAVAHTLQHIKPGDHVAFVTSRDAIYPIVQWGIWLKKAVAVPIHSNHPIEEINYILQDSKAAALVYNNQLIQQKNKEKDFQSRLTACVKANKLKQVVVDDDHPQALKQKSPDQLEAIIAEFIPDFDAFMPMKAQMLYTSGTTGRPKGVLTTHLNLTTQISDLVEAWEMTANDHILHFLPLHHTHGILCKLLCILYVGGTCEFMPSANAKLLWQRLASKHLSPPTIFMAVPTIYMQLLEEWEKKSLSPDMEKNALETVKNFRVTISGSMGCPMTILEKWHDLFGQYLVERYGMTELGMILTNPIPSQTQRNSEVELQLGYVGRPLPSITVKLVDSDTKEVIVECNHRQSTALKSDVKSSRGELLVSGEGVFQQYWNRAAEVTEKEFDHSYFKTGDIAEYNWETANFRICGRASIDIIKSAGYKISALDIEKILLQYEGVMEASVFGKNDEKWGEIVVAVLRTSKQIQPQEIHKFVQQVQAYCRLHLADYKIPREILLIPEIPKNAMGKVNKKSLRNHLFPEIYQ